MTKQLTISALLISALFLGTNPAFGVNFVELDTVFGGKGSGAGGFSAEIHLAFDRENNIIVSDAANRLIQKLSADGTFLFQYPAADAESLDVALFKPGDVAVDMVGNIYVADTTVIPVPRKDEDGKTPPIYLYTPCVHKFDPNGKFLKTIPIDTLSALPKSPVTPVKEIVTAEGEYALAIQPKGYDRAVKIDVDPQGNLFVLDAERPSRQVVHKFSPDGEKITSFGRYGGGDGEFDGPKDLAVGANGHVYIADTGNHRIVHFDNDGNFVGAFASKGLGANEVTKPYYITSTASNELFVADESMFVRRRLGPLGSTLLTGPGGPAWQTVGDEGLRVNRRFETFADPLSPEERLARRLYRLEELYLLEKEDEEQEALTDEALKKAYRIRNTLYHTVMRRVLRFGLDGSYIDSATYRLDQLDETLHDLVFVAADPLGNLYLQDESDLTIRRYRVVGFSLNLNEVDAISSSRFLNRTNEFLEDYEDIDQVPDTQQQETVMQASSRLVFNYDITPMMNFLIEDAFEFAGRDGDQEYPERIENGITFEDRNVDNRLTVGLRRILNPNPYRYKELNFFVLRKDGTSRLDSDALFPELNKQASRQSGDSAETSFGIDWDVFRNVNLRMEYQILNPSDTSRNYTREFFDLEGNLYQVLRTRNESKLWVGELNIKF